MAKKAPKPEVKEEPKGHFLRIPRRLFGEGSGDRLVTWYEMLATRMYADPHPECIEKAADHLKHKIPEDSGSGFVIVRAGLGQLEAVFRMVQKLKQFDVVRV